MEDRLSQTSLRASERTADVPSGEPIQAGGPGPGSPLRSVERLATQRCFNHASREAVARCPECGRFFCRECVTEHDDRAICAACLKKLAGLPLLQRRGVVHLVHFAQGAVSVLLAWFCFYMVGEGLLLLPDSFHEQTLWQVPWLEEE